MQSFSLSSTLGGKWMVSSGGGTHPKWPRDGTELFYQAPGHRIMAVQARTGDAFQAEVARPLFEAGIVDDFRVQFAVAERGRRFLIPVAVSQPNSSAATIVVNWMNGIKQ